MAARVQRGRAVTILRVKDDGGFELDLDILRRVLLAEHARDMPVVAISMAGGHRTGKSLHLDFLLHYLRNSCPNDWLESCVAGLDDFSWSGNFEGQTVGVLVWDEVFQVTMPDGRTVAVLLMDTQGGFHGHHTAKGCAAFLTLKYGQLAAKDITPFQKPFQKLVFLVRDWYYPLSAPYGPNGGLDVLHQRLKAPVVQTTEMRIVREHIDACFKRKGCFLLPYPWREVRWSFSTGTL
ncbi:atlastin-1-like [Amblyomma americanum]